MFPSWEVKPYKGVLTYLLNPINMRIGFFKVGFTSSSEYLLVSVFLWKSRTNVEENNKH